MIANSQNNCTLRTVPVVEWENLSPPYRYFDEDSIAPETTQPRQIHINDLGTDVHQPTAQLIDGGNGIPIVSVVNATQQDIDNRGLLLCDCNTDTEGDGLSDGLNETKMEM